MASTTTKTPAAKTSTKTAAPKTTTRDASKPYTKPEWIARLMADCQLSRDQAAAVYDWFGTIAAKELGKRGSGMFLVPGVARFTRTLKAATKAHAGRNPATGETMTIPARPAHPVVRASVVKALAELIESGK